MCKISAFQQKFREINFFLKNHCVSWFQEIFLFLNFPRREFGNCANLIYTAWKLSLEIFREINLLLNDLLVRESRFHEIYSHRKNISSNQLFTLCVEFKKFLYHGFSEKFPWNNFDSKEFYQFYCKIDFTK